MWSAQQPRVPWTGCGSMVATLPEKTAIGLSAVMRVPERLPCPANADAESLEISVHTAPRLIVTEVAPG